YPERKQENIKLAISQVREILERHRVNVVEVLAVSSYMEWNPDPQNAVSSVEQVEYEIEFDGRYQIDRLVDVLADSMSDFRAAIGLMSASKLGRKLGRTITNTFATITATVA